MKTLMLMTAVLMAADCAQAQTVGYSLRWSYSGPHPAVAYQRARMMDLTYRRAKLAWRNEARDNRRSFLRQRLQEKLNAYEEVKKNRRRQAEQQAEVYASRIDCNEGVIDWPDRLLSEYGNDVSQLDDLFCTWATGEGGIGSRNYSETLGHCDLLLARMKRDLKQRRFKAAEYLYLKHFVGEVRSMAGRLPDAVMVARARE